MLKEHLKYNSTEKWDEKNRFFSFTTYVDR